MKIIIMFDTAQYATELYKETKDLILKKKCQQIIEDFNKGQQIELNNKYYSIVV